MAEEKQNTAFDIISDILDRVERNKDFEEVEVKYRDFRVGIRRDTAMFDYEGFEEHELERLKNKK